MSSEHSSTHWPDYATFANALALVDPGYEWLAAFFAHIPEETTAEGRLSIWESHTVFSAFRTSHLTT